MATEMPDAAPAVVRRYYPYYYAPLASDLVDLHSVPRLPDFGPPVPAFSPLAQLLAVLPPASAAAAGLPESYQQLMVDR